MLGSDMVAMASQLCTNKLGSGLKSKKKEAENCTALSRYRLLYQN